MRLLVLALLLLGACSGRLPTEFSEVTLLGLHVPDGSGDLDEVSTDGAPRARLDPLLFAHVIGRAVPAEAPVLLKGRGHLVEARTRGGEILRLEACLYGSDAFRRLIRVEGTGWMEVAEVDASAWIADTDRALATLPEPALIPPR